MKCFGGSKSKKYHCKVVLLDETELIQEFQDISKGQDILDVVFKHLNLLETVYFGLRYIQSNGQACWLDSNKIIIKQLKEVNPMTLYFGVKFYASDPCKLLEEITRYQFFLQIKQDILQSRLPVPIDLLAHLFAYAVQSELGDYDPRRHQYGYISEFRFVANQTLELENRVAELHKSFSGQVPATAEMNFLERVKWLDLYGADLHPVLGEDNVEYFLGLTPSGVIVLRNKMKVGNYFWPRIVKISRKDKYFMLQVAEKNNEGNTYGFELPNKHACKHLWKCCIEHQAFFKLAQNRDRIGAPNNKFAGFTQRFRYSGRNLINRSSIGKKVNCINERPPNIVRIPSRRFQKRLGQPDGADANTKEECHKLEYESSIIVPPGRHIAQPVIYRSTSVPNTLTVNDSPKSIRSAPWENPNQKGLFSCSIPSPRSVRNGLSGYHSSFDFNRYYSSRRDSTSSIVRYKSSRASGDESEVSRCSRSSKHSHHSNKSKSSRCKHKSGEESGTESDSSRKKQRRRRKSSNNYKLIDSEQQWKEIQRKQQTGELNGVRSGVAYNMIVKDYCNQRKLSGYNNEMESDAEPNDELNLRRKHNRAKSPESLKKDGINDIRKYTEYRLIDNEEDKRNISYTRVETDNSRLFRIRYSPTTGKARYKLEKTHYKQNSLSSDSKSNNDENSIKDFPDSIPSQMYASPKCVLKSSFSHNSNYSSSNGENHYIGKTTNHDHSFAIYPIDDNHVHDNYYSEKKSMSNSYRPINRNNNNIGIRQELDQRTFFDNQQGIRFIQENRNFHQNHSGNPPRVTFQTPPSTTAYYNEDVSQGDVKTVFSRR